MRVVVPFPLDQILDAAVSRSRIEDLVNLEVFYVIHDSWIGWTRLQTTREGIRGHGDKLDHWEDWVQTAQ